MSFVLAFAMLLSVTPVAVFAAATAVAKIGNAEYTDLQEALNAGGVVELLKDVAISSKLYINKDVIIDGNGYTITASGTNRLFRINDSAKTGNAANVVFTDIIIKNNTANSRCIETRSGDLSLTLNGVELYSTGPAYDQALTVGGSGNNITVNIVNSVIKADTHYGIVTFNPVNMTITNSEITGFAALYMKGADGSLGSVGSVVNVVNSSLAGTNTAKEGSGAFGAIVVEDSNIVINLTDNSSVIAAGSCPDGQYAVMDNSKYTGVAISNIQVNADKTSQLICTADVGGLVYAAGDADSIVVLPILADPFQDIRDYLEDNAYITPEQRNALVNYVHGVLTSGEEITADQVLDIAKYIYGTLLYDVEMENDDKIAMILGIYSILKTNNYLTAYAKEVKILEDLCAQEALAVVTADQIFTITDCIYNAVEDNEVTNEEIRAIASFIYFDVFNTAPVATFALRAAVVPTITPAEKLAIVEAVYTVLKDNDYLVTTPELKPVEDLYTALKNEEEVTDEHILEIFDIVVTTFVESETIEEVEMNKVAEQVADVLMKDESISDATKMEIIGQVTEALGNTTGGSTATPDLTVVNELFKRLKDAGYITDAQAVEIINYIYPKLLSGEKLTNQDLVNIAKRVYDVVLKDSNLTVEDAIAIVNIVYSTLKEYNVVTDEQIGQGIVALYQKAYTYIVENYNEIYAYAWNLAKAQGFVDMANGYIDQVAAVIS
ncbi:MAG: hypothetical protein II263_02485, partial [Lachnospiraceae bacterium]|nr:hypothetical protein [Lachnospiraceae bacterium]